MREQVADTFRRVAFQRSFAHRLCAHLDGVADRTSTARACPHCEEGGRDWVHLRMFMTCGMVGCCDSSQDRHARAHFETTGHPLIRSMEPGEAWVWCYVDRAYLTPFKT